MSHLSLLAVFFVVKQAGTAVRWLFSGGDNLVLEEHKGDAQCGAVQSVYTPSMGIMRGQRLKNLLKLYFQ